MKVLAILSRACLTISILCFVKEDRKSRVITCFDIICLVLVTFVEGLLTGRGTI